MLWDKGIGEFVEAARRLLHTGTVARFVLVGRCDEHNPAAIDSYQLRHWVQERIVEWWDHRDDMPAVFAQATLVVLPSYREGLPKVLLEAAACGKPLIATDVPGCREVVRQGVNGLLVPPKDSQALSDAIASLLEDGPRRALMGHASRQLVEQEYSVENVTAQVIGLYRELLAAQ
jgi:glycosyltransferase involved in cell wall biosynthesis